MTNTQRVDVVLEIEFVPKGSRVHMMGVYRPGIDSLPPITYDVRNTVQTWVGGPLPHDVSAFLIDQNPVAS